MFATSPTREIDFEYDHNGLRTQKKVVENGITTVYDYTLHGKLITHLTKRVVDLDGVESSEELHFFYDAQSKPAFVEYGGIKYRYIHNLQGDIVAIVNPLGIVVTEYRYDTWGMQISATTSMVNVLEEVNPFRYRGYIWDKEICMYYLRDRYYNSKVGRFINQDKCLISAQRIGGTNVFAYCVNRPAQGCDPDGKRYIDALSVASETKQQRHDALVYTKNTRPKAAPASVVKAIDEYLEIRNFDRLSNVYQYNDGDTQYYYTVIGGMWKRERFQYIDKYEKFRTVFRIDTYESMSIADAISRATDLASIYFQTIAPWYASSSQQSDAFSFLAEATGTLSNQYNNVDFGQLTYTPIYSFEAVSLEKCSLIN